jgi:hypothetical protein
MVTPRYNVFISFSGETSLGAAKALREWLPSVVQAAKPFMSESDVEKGTRGLQEITGALEAIKVGIVCLSPDNLGSPWLHYESGALSKSIGEKTRLCTYLLCGLQPKDVSPPLSMFQHTTAQKEETRQLVRTINRAVNEEPIADPTLDAVFQAMWPKLELVLGSIPQPGERSSPRRSVEEMVAEILELTRAATNSRKESQWIDKYTPMLKEFFPLLEQLIMASKQPGAAQGADRVPVSPPVVYRPPEER